jgi:hypothetical protein
MTARFNARVLSHLLAKALALLMLAAIAAPYAHAALEITQHEQCGMEECKRAGKCCCKRRTPGKFHWDAKDICHHGDSQPPALISPATTPEPLAIVTILNTTHASLPAIAVTHATTYLLAAQFPKPPPSLS